MLDFLIDLFLILIGLKKRKERKEEDKELISLNINKPNHKEDTEKELTKQEMSVCAACNRTLESGAVYEQGKTWCTECYKTHVLKV